MKIPEYNKLKNIELNKTGLYMGIAVFLLFIMILFWLWPSGKSMNQVPDNQKFTGGNPAYLQEELDSAKVDINKPIALKTNRTGQWQPPKPSELFGDKTLKKLKSQTMVNAFKQSTPTYYNNGNEASRNYSNQNNLAKKARRSKLFINAAKKSELRRVTRPPTPSNQYAAGRTKGVSTSKQRNIPTTPLVGKKLQRPLLSGGMYRQRSRNQQGTAPSYNYSSGQKISSQFRRPATPYVLQEGTMIPATLITGINSELPGNIIAIVNRDVYDSIQQKYLLIPEGTKLIGSYKGSIALGQEKLLMSWNRIIFPDGKSLVLPSINSYDLQGQSGVTGDVDKHFWSTFLKSAALSVIGASVSVATQDQTRGGIFTNRTQGVGELTAQQVATTFNRIATQVLSRNLNRRPTIHIPQGKQFLVFLAGDITFPHPYRYNPPKPNDR